MGAAGSQHWFDRLAVRHTRRQALGTSLAAAAALTVPLLRPRAARASGPFDCGKGCQWTANRRFAAALQKCGGLAATGGGLLERWGWVPVLPIVAAQYATAAAHCLDNAVIDSKAASWLCHQPGCPGFDPNAPDAPCAACKGNPCCTCAASTNGYICCAYPCDDPGHDCCPP
jgi:hypothetical protein